MSNENLKYNILSLQYILVDRNDRLMKNELARIL